MRDLTAVELDNVSGGVMPLLLATLGFVYYKQDDVRAFFDAFYESYYETRRAHLSVGP